MKRNPIIHYNPELKKRARYLRTKCTPVETLLWSKIRKKSFGYEFHRQVPIDEYIVDFYCHELKLAIEVDGSSHESKKTYDLNRQSKLENLGVTFVRFDNEDVKKGMTEVLTYLGNVIAGIEKQAAFFQERHPPDPLQRGNGFREV